MATTTSARIDEEINKHLVLVADLCAQKNSLLPIFRLPPETLANIFIHGACNYHESSDGPTFRVPCWVNVSYVCRHWRDVALNCPTLWTYHFTVSLRWTDELLARSKHASLRIHIRSDSQRRMGWWSDLVETLLSHRERIQELRLRVPVLPSKLSLRAPCLQILDINGTWSRPFERTVTIDDGDIPPLRTLKLTDYPLPWHTLNLSGLTTLFLCRVPAPKQNIVEFLAALGRMQGLTYLHLEDALASARGFLSGGEFDVSPQIGLPCLTRLLVAGPLSVVVALLSCINIPMRTSLRLEFQQEGGSSIEDCAEISSILVRRFTQPKDLSLFSPAIRSLAIHSSLFQFSLCASIHDDCGPYVSTNCPQWDSDLPLVIYLRKENLMMDNNWFHITSDLCCSIPLGDVRTLHVVNPPLSPDFWRKMLGHLHGLRHMKLSDGLMPNLVSLLAVPAEPTETLRGKFTTSDHDLTPGHIFVPVLDELELRYIAFATEADLSEDAVSEKLLLDALATREVPPRLTMIACHAEEDESNMEDDEESDYSDGYY